MLVNYVLIFLVLLLFAGLGVDAGMLELRYLQLSAAVKASAISGALALQRGSSSTTINSAGLTSASLNGFTDGTNGVTVTIQNPPTAGPYAGNPYSVRSTIQFSAPTAFMGLAGFPTVSLSLYYDAPGAAVVPMTSSFNVYAIVTDTSAVTNGGFDNGGNALSANLLDPVRASNNLGPLLSWRGNLFFLGVPNGANAASQNTNIPLTSGNFSQLLILAGTAYGAHTNVQFVVNYTDSSTATAAFSMSDWCYLANYSNEVQVQGTPYRDHLNNGPSYDCTPSIYGYTMNLDNTRTVSSIALPNTRTAVVFAMDLVP